jgi:thermitase
MIKNLKFFVVFLVFLFGMNFLFSAETKKYADGEILIKFKAGSALSSKSSLKKSSTGEIDVDSFFEKNKTKYKISEHNKIFNNLDNSTNLTKSSMSKRKNVNTSEVEEIKDSLNKIYKIKFSTDSDAKEMAEEIAKNEEIEWAEPNYIFHKSDVTPNDTYVNYQWHLYGDWSGDSKGTSNKNINAKTAWDISEGSSDIIVAVIDDGLAIKHDDIKDNVWTNSREISGNGIDDDGNGYIDDVNGWNFVLGTNSIEPIKYNDTNQGWMYEDHGTHVSGIIGAKGNNNLGVAGINWNSKIMLLKLFNGNDEKNGGSDILVQAITYAVNNGASVINMSLGADIGSTALQTAINYAYANGVVTVAAAGNDGSNSIDYPANYSNVIAVASTDYQDKKSYFSNYGTNIDISAPGSSIYSLNDWHNSNPPYQYMSGTSMATPVVTGVVSLLLSVNPTLTPDEIINILKTKADSIY